MLRAQRRLLALTIVPAVVETSMLWALGDRAGLALAPQVSAPVPFGLFHDLRWLIVYHQSWPGFALELAAILSLRAWYTVLLVRAAWPAGTGAPAVEVRRIFGLTAVQAALLFPWVVLLFVTGFVSLPWLFIVAVPCTFATAAIVHHGAVVPGWWRSPPPRESVIALTADFAALTLLGGVMSVSPGWAGIPLAVVAGCVNAWCWQRMVALPPAQEKVRRRPFAVTAMATVLAVVVLGTVVGFATAQALEAGRTPLPVVSDLADGAPVIVVKGFNSEWDGVTRRWVNGDFHIRRFSYAGVDAAGRPRPYTRDDTHRSLGAIAHELGQQVDALALATGEQVGIVAESEGALAAKLYVTGTPDAPVRALVLLSPLLEPGRVYYPPRGRSGWGVAGGVVLDGLSALVAGLGPVNVSAATPIFRSIVEHAPTVQGLLGCRARDIRELAVLPVDSGLGAPPPTDVALPYVVRPAVHGGLLGDATTKRLVTRALLGRGSATPGFWGLAERVVQAGAAPWQVPSLARAINDAWVDAPDPQDCREVRAGAREWLQTASVARTGR